MVFAMLLADHAPPCGFLVHKDKPHVSHVYGQTIFMARILCHQPNALTKRLKRLRLGNKAQRLALAYPHTSTVNVAGSLRKSGRMTLFIPQV